MSEPVVEEADMNMNMNNNKALALEEEVNNLRAAYTALQEQSQALQHENEDLKLKLQSQNDAISESNTSVATAAAAAQLNNYQQALNLSEAQKQQMMAENESLKAKLAQLGITFTEATEGAVTVADATCTNDPTATNETLNAIAAEDEPDENWEVHFNALVKFKETHGHLHIGYEEEPTISKWIQIQRILYRNKSLVEKRALRLESINFFEETTDVPDVANAAVAVAAMDHSAALDISAAEAEALAAVDTTVHHHAHHHDATTVPVLTSPGTGLSSRSDEKWEQHFQRLVDYKNTNGNCLVPTSTELGRWLCRQRHNHRYKGLKEERKLRLVELDPTCLGERLSDINGGGGGDMMNNGDPNGMHGTPQLSTKTKYNLAYESKLHAKWDHYFQQLVTYKEEHGHSNFPTMNGSLGRWISRQRTLYRSQKLKSDRFEKLKSIGFAFEDATALEFKGKLDLQWENMFTQLTEHKERTGHCFDVPEDMPLGKWLYRQRWLYRHGNLRNDRAKKLLEIGFEDKKVLKKDTDGNKKRKRKRSTGEIMVEEQEGLQEAKHEEEEQHVSAIETNGSANEEMRKTDENGVEIPFDQIMEDRPPEENQSEQQAIEPKPETALEV